MDQLKLDADDIKHLFETLEAWEQEPVSKGLFESLMESLFRSMAGERRSRQEVVEHVTAERKKAEAARELRKEQNIFVRAKLLKLRDQMVAEAAVQEALKK